MHVVTCSIVVFYTYLAFERELNEQLHIIIFYAMVQFNVIDVATQFNDIRILIDN